MRVRRNNYKLDKVASAGQEEAKNDWWGQWVTSHDWVMSGVEPPSHQVNGIHDTNVLVSFN